MKSLIKEIEAYIALATGMKEQFPAVRRMDFAIDGKSIEEVEEAAKHFNVVIEESIGKCLRIYIKDYEIGYDIFAYSVPCEIEKTITYKPKPQAA